jgi:ribonuclease R
MTHKRTLATLAGAVALAMSTACTTVEQGRPSGAITGVTTFGLFVQLENTAEGLVHVQGMADDFYRYDPERFMLVGEDRGHRYRLGETVRVRVLSVSPADARIELELA